MGPPPPANGIHQYVLGNNLRRLPEGVSPRCFPPLNRLARYCLEGLFTKKMCFDICCSGDNIELYFSKSGGLNPQFGKNGPF